MSSPSISPHAAGLADRHNGMTTVAANSPTYAEAARDAIARIQPGTEFTADTIRAAIPQHITAHHPNVLPSVFGALASAGTIRRIAETNSTRRTRHASRNGIWIKNEEKNA